MTKSKIFLRKFGDFLKRVSVGIKRSTPALFSRITNSASMFRPGDILVFDYLGSPRSCLVVRTPKTNSGVYIAQNTKNLLVTCFNFNPESQAASIILAEVYKNVMRSEYTRLISRFKTLLGKQNFRTYKLNQMTNIVNLRVDKRKF